MTFRAFKFFNSVSLVFLLTLGLAFSVQAGSSRPPGPPTATQVSPGGVAPDFELPDLEGERVKLSDFRGQVVLLTFWASWCPPCRAEMPSLNQLQATLGPEGLQLLAVNIEKNSTPARRYVDSQKLSFLVLLDVNTKVQQDYGVFNVPQSFLIDKSGTIVERYLGAYDWMSDELLQSFRAVLRKP